MDLVSRLQRLRRTSALGAAALTLLLLLGGCDREPSPRSEAAGVAPRSGGGLVVALRSDPRGFNPVFAADNNTLTITRRLHADLIHIDRASRETVPALAQAWEISDDGRRFVLTLRPNLRFSDGEPMTVEDVVFSYRVLLDEEVASAHRELLIIGGEPIAVAALDERRVVFELAAPYAVGDRIFDSIPILPRHKLENAYLAGELASAWGLDASPDDVVGMGPFRLREYVPGERVVVERNPHYWRRSAGGDELPYLDTLSFLIVPSRDTQVLRFQNGDLHLIDRLNAESFELLRDGPRADRYRLTDLGPDLTFLFLFFNRNDLLPDSPHAPRQRWFAEPAFRQAVSTAIDRQAIIDLAFGGRATAIATHASPGLGRWFDPALEPPERSADRARSLLAAAGFSWDAEDRLRDPEGAPVAWSLITNSSNAQRVQTLAIVREDLAEIGMEVQVVPMDFGAMLDRVMNTHDYSACLLGLGGGDADPNSQMTFLASTGARHLWRLADEGAPEAWQREIDDLLARQLVSLDADERQRLYFRVQRLVADHLPFIPLVSPHLLVGAQAEVGNFSPVILDHQTLWNADELFLAAPP